MLEVVFDMFIGPKDQEELDQRRNWTTNTWAEEKIEKKHASCPYAYEASHTRIATQTTSSIRIPVGRGEKKVSAHTRMERSICVAAKSSLPVRHKPYAHGSSRAIRVRISVKWSHTGMGGGHTYMSGPDLEKRPKFVYFSNKKTWISTCWTIFKYREHVLKDEALENSLWIKNFMNFYDGRHLFFH